MPEQVIDQALAGSPAQAPAPPLQTFAESRRARSVVRRLLHPAVLTAAGLVVAAAIVVAATGTRPGFDPFGWLVWGRQTLFWNLNTNGAPSWKPLPYLFTVPFALFGRGELWLWMVFAVAVDLSGAVFGYRIAHRLIGVADGRRYPAIVGGVVAGFGVVAIDQYSHFILSAQSDPMIVSMCLAAVDANLSKRPRIALAMLALAGLGRPEAWAFLGLYGLWMWRSVPRSRLVVAGGFFAQPLLWFGIPALTASSWFVAGNLALHSPRKLHENKIVGVLHRFVALQAHPLELVVLVCIVWAVIRRDRLTLGIAAAAALWVVVEIAFALHGWPAVPRYLFEPAALEGVLAGVAVGWALALPATLPEGLRGRLPVDSLSRRLAEAAAVLAVLGFGGAMVPAAVHAERWEHKDLLHERSRTRQLNNLKSLIAQLGGPLAIRRCGQPTSVVEYQSIFAWYENMNVGFVGFDVGRVTAAGRPAVFFNPHGEGWHVGLIHVQQALQASCERFVAIAKADWPG